MTVLVVDDSKIMRNIVKNHFDEFGLKCDFLEADNGMTALQLLGSNSIHLVMLDWNMPQLSGIDFLKKVRAIPQYETLPIVMVTSESARYNVVEALKCGATDYIIKPISAKNFKDKISKIDFSKIGKPK
ncbi:MAG: response regulator [Spirochaetaceae bacterium]|jgi:two-component system chemotaxis response regulator CheY|nr:response regulator [Spirochaetaceae bacterium]